MPSLLRLAARLLLAAAVAISALAVASALAQTPPATGVSVTIQPPGGGTPQTISTADVTPDIRDQTYAVGPQRTPVRVARGVSVLQLLKSTQTNFDYAEIEIPRPDGTVLRLTKDEVKDIKPQGFYTDDQGVTHFIGPTASDGSVATQDYFTVSSSITLTQLRQSKLQVTISPSRKKIELGGTVQFKATVTGDEDGETVVYTWGINGRKQTQAGPRFRQKFPSKDDVYEFLVSVRFEGSESGDTAVAKITVGDPEKSKDGQTGSGDSADGGSTGSTGGGSGAGATYTPSYTAPTAPSTPLSPTPAPPSTPSAKPPTPPDIATSGTTVEGNLLADISDPPPSNILESAARAAREGKQPDDDSAADGAGVSEAALSIVGVLALLALGAGIETRQGRLPRWRRPHLRLPRRAA